MSSSSDRAGATSSSSSSSGGSVVWSTALLNLLHAPLTPQNYQFVNQWATREHNGGPALSDGSNNPFFTTAGAGGTVGPLRSGLFPEWNSIGVAKYPTLGIGVYANALHIGSQYPAIARALRSGNPGAYAGDPSFQHELTTWSGGGYAGFSAIPAAAGPVGPTLDTHQMMVDVGNAITGKPVHSGGGGVTGFVKGLPGDVVSGVGDIAGGANSIARHIPGVAQAEGIASFLGKLTDPSYILRGLQIVAGAGLVATGATLLVRQIALASDLPDPVAAVASRGASLAAPTGAAVE